ncbi:general odorant-binding protein 28a-like [Leguminivora glycinivorella]|uniref:general odorant-binding protein 28a-like n=1 Tax=Leguminivora glycinivorella TaxID=1035111 RepID=UPI00200F611C|nr:general odorant-binding protein 28a-like [Leguminivora glycinivorella]
MARVAFVLIVAAVANGVWAISGIQKTVIQAEFVTRGLSCLKSNPLTVEDINSLRMLKLPESNNAKCFTACLFKNIGIMDNSGAVSASNARKNAKQVFANDETSLNNVEKLVKECEKVNAENVADDMGCDRAALAFACLTQKGAKYGLDLKF